MCQFQDCMICNCRQHQTNISSSPVGLWQNCHHPSSSAVAYSHNFCTAITILKIIITVVTIITNCSFTQHLNSKGVTRRCMSCAVKGQRSKVSTFIYRHLQGNPGQQQFTIWSGVPTHSQIAYIAMFLFNMLMCVMYVTLIGKRMNTHNA